MAQSRETRKANKGYTSAKIFSDPNNDLMLALSTFFNVGQLNLQMSQCHRDAFVKWVSKIKGVLSKHGIILLAYGLTHYSFSPLQIRWTQNYWIVGIAFPGESHLRLEPSYIS